MSRLTISWAAALLGLSSWACSEPPVQVVTRTHPEATAMVDSLPAYSKAELLGQFDPAGHVDFSRVPDDWTDKKDIYLRSEVLQAYGQMREAALRDGVNLLIRSATRNFEYQRGIWERKWVRPQYMGWQAVDKARDILTYSAMPGASRHHWGTDIDLNSFENEWFESDQGATLYAWLQQHAGAFGFHQIYDDKSTGRTGYELERWHWSYLPVARPMLTAFNELVQPADLTTAPFSGAETADSLKVLSDFVNGVNLPPR